MVDEQPNTADDRNLSRSVSLDLPMIYGQSAIAYEDFVSDFMSPFFGALWHLGVALQDEFLGFSAHLGGFVFETLWGDDDADNPAAEKVGCHDDGAGLQSGETRSSARMDSLRTVELLSPDRAQHFRHGTAPSHEESDRRDAVYIACTELPECFQPQGIMMAPPLRSSLKGSAPKDIASGKRVRFEPQVSFWFPAAGQLDMPSGLVRSNPYSLIGHQAPAPWPVSSVPCPSLGVREMGNDGILHSPWDRVSHCATFLGSFAANFCSSSRDHAMESSNQLHSRTPVTNHCGSTHGRPLGGSLSLEGGIPSSATGGARTRASLPPFGPSGTESSFGNASASAETSSLEGGIPSSVIGASASQSAPLSCTGSTAHTTRATGSGSLDTLSHVPPYRPILGPSSIASVGVRSLEGCIPSSVLGGARTRASHPSLGLFCTEPSRKIAVAGADASSLDGGISSRTVGATAFSSAFTFCPAFSAQIARATSYDGSEVPADVRYRSNAGYTSAARVGVSSSASSLSSSVPSTQHHASAPFTHQALADDSIECELDRCVDNSDACTSLLVSLQSDCYDPTQIGGNGRGKGLVIPVGRAPHALVHTGQRATEAPQLSASSAAEAKALASTVTDRPNYLPFTSFDIVNGPKSLMGQTNWQEHDFVLRAIEASGLPGSPHGRILRYPVKDFACPQVVLLRGGHPIGKRAVVIDSRFIGGDVHVLEMPPHTLIIEVVRTLVARHSFGALLDTIRVEAVRISVDGVPTALNDEVPSRADVFEFHEGGAGGSPGPLETASAATTEPFEVVLQPRPDTPPIPSAAITVARRWKREGVNSVAEQAAEANKVRTRFLRRGVPRCTVYDPLRQVEVVHTTACEEPFGLLNWAVTRARHLGPTPDGRVINHALASFPSPQVCLHPPIRADFVALPVEVSPGYVCTVVSSRDASALALMIQLERDCSVTRMQRLLLTRGVIKMIINDVEIDDIHERDALILADTARITPHYVLLEHGVVPEVETLAPHWRNAVGPFVLHRPGLAPVEVHLPVHLSPSGVRHALIGLGFLDNAGSIHMPYVCPAVPGVGVHLLLLNRQQVESEITYAVHDVRRAIHPPFVPYWTSPVAHQAHLDFLTEVLHDAFPVLGPILEVFYDTRPLHNALEHGGCPWLTVMGFPRVSSPHTPVLEPALQPTDELSRLRAGYRATFSRLRRSHVPAVGPADPRGSSVRTSIAENGTCPVEMETTTTTTTCPHGPPPDVSSACAATTTTSTPAARPIAVTPDSWQAFDVVVHVMGDQAAIASTTQNGRGHLAEILATVTWCLHANGALTTHSVLSACPRVFLGPDGRCHLFAQARGPGCDRFLWIFAPEWHTLPLSIPWSASLELADVLDAVGLLPDDVAIVSVDGVLRCEHPAAARPGSVICVASTKAQHYTLPLHLLSDRILGVQTLLFCASGPDAGPLNCYDDLRSFFYDLVAEASKCVGEFRRGKRFLIVRAGLAPILCCAGTALPPTLHQAQNFYDSSLQQHFGAIRLKDTAQVPHDVALFVGRYNPREQRVWLLPYEGGADAYLGDLDGCCLAEVPAPLGYRIEPSVRSAWCGLARLQPRGCPAEAPVTECLVRLPPGLSSSSDESPTLVHDARNLTPEEVSIIARWEARNHAALSTDSPRACSSTDPFGGGIEAQSVSSSSASSSSSSSGSSEPEVVEDASMLQVSNGKRMALTVARRLPTPCRSNKLPCLLGDCRDGQDGIPILVTDADEERETTPVPSSTPACLSGARREVLPDVIIAQADGNERRHAISLSELLPEPRPVEASLQFGVCHEMIADVLDCRRPCDLCMDFSRIRDLPSAVRDALLVPCSPCQWEECHHVDIFTDGSFRASDGSMAWALVAVGFDHCNCRRLTGYMSGGIGLPGESGHFGNTACNAHVAELAALLGAMLLAANLSPCPARICYDAQSAGGIASGTMFPHSTDALAEAVGHVFGLLHALRVPVSFLHVRAHTGVLWNECADAIAKTACNADGWRTVQQDPLPGLLQGPELAWLWLLAERACSGLPAVARDGTSSRLLVAPPEPIWHRMPGIPRLSAEPKVSKLAHIQFTVATYNTLSLRNPAQVEALDACFHRAGIHFVGLQETRVDDQARGATAHFHVYRSRADKGQLGCQIWVHKAFPLDEHGNRPKPSSVVILHSTPRVLALTVDTGGVCLALVSAHAPTSAADDFTIDAWWTDLKEVICRFPPRALPVIMVDANARFDRHSADPILCKALNRNAVCMRDLLEHFGLCASQLVDVGGHPVTSWTSPLGKPDCIDFVLLPARSANQTQTLGCPPEFGDTFGHDHRPIHVRHRIQRCSRPCPTSPLLDREAMMTPQGRRNLARIFESAPEVPCEVDVDTHLDILNTYTMQALGEAFPAHPARPRNKTFSDRTWAAIRLRRDIRRKLTMHRRAARCIAIRACFRAWANNRHAPVSEGGLCSSRQVISLVLSLRRLNRSVRQLVAADQATHCRDLMGEAQFASPERRFAIYRGVLKLGRRYRAPQVQHAVCAEGRLHSSKADIQMAFGQHFAKPEGGELLAIDALHADSQQTLTLPDVLQLNGIPTLQTLAQNFARAAPRKATGPSGIPPEALRGAAFPAAKCHMSLVLKSCARSRPPLLWRGGAVHAIPKPSKPMHDVTGWRSILLMEIAAKGVGKCMRQELAGALAQCAVDLHGGSRKGMPLEVPMHAVRAHGQRLKKARVAGAVIFLDGANAFYSVLREHLHSVDALSSPAKLQSFAESVFARSEDQTMLLEVLAAPGVLQDTQVPPAVASYLRHSLHASWFAVGGDMDCLFRTFTGTGPGAPLADILFQLVFTRFHSQMQEELEQLGLLCRSFRHRAKAPLPGWADDLAILLEVPHADQLLPAIRQAAAVAHRAMASTGVIMNFSAGKSEVVPLLYGPGSAPVRRELLSQRDPLIEVTLCDGKRAQLHVVKEYVHLGGVFAHDTSVMQDVERRRREAELPYRRLRATLLRNPCLDKAEKTFLLCSLIFSKYLHGAGLWHLQKGQEVQAYRAGMMGFMRRSMRPILGVSSALASDHEVCTVLGLLTPDEALSRLHIMQLSFLASFASLWLFDAIVDAGDWLKQALQSLSAAVTACGIDLQPPEPSELATWLSGRQLQLRHLARRYKRACLASRADLAASVLQELRRRAKLVDAGGLIFSRQDLAAGSGEFFCDLCQTSCGSAPALAAHKAKSHRVLPNASFGFGTACQVCMVECWDDNRMRDHLRRHPACAGAYAHSDISSGGELSSKWVAAWRPVAKLAGPQPWWATLQPEEEIPQQPRNTLAMSVSAVLKPVPAGQSKVKVWALKYFKLLVRADTGEAERVVFPEAPEEALRAFSAAKLLLLYSESGGPISNDRWKLTAHGNRVELVPV